MGVGFAEKSDKIWFKFIQNRGCLLWSEERKWEKLAEIWSKMQNNAIKFADFDKNTYICTVLFRNTTIMVTEGMVRESPLQVIFKAQCGKLSELEERLGKREVRRLEAMGFIQNAPSEYGETWKISSRAQRLAELKSKPYTKRERRSDFCRFKLPKLLFGAWHLISMHYGFPSTKRGSQL